MIKEWLALVQPFNIAVAGTAITNGKGSQLAAGTCTTPIQTIIKLLIE